VGLGLSYGFSGATGKNPYSTPAGTKRRQQEEATMSAIPKSYLDIINPLIDMARQFLEEGQTLAPIAFVGNFENAVTIPIAMEASSPEAKLESANTVRTVAELYDADFIFLLMEAWTLRQDKVREMERILERYGSIGASPYAVDIVSMALETRHGVWMAQPVVKPKGASKKKRTFDNPNFRQYSDIQGRFVDLLPKKEGAASQKASLH
jgi:hypothetical protein